MSKGSQMPETASQDCSFPSALTNLVDSFTSNDALDVGINYYTADYLISQTKKSKEKFREKNKKERMA